MKNPNDKYIENQDLCSGSKSLNSEISKLCKAHYEYYLQFIISTQIAFYQIDLPLFYETGLKHISE